ncbi:MAG: DUF362 domain-containing protein [Planctomycetes bacterium]|nr:DUF362 domain-containing protein [Planctomycetota bacterium]
MLLFRKKSVSSLCPKTGKFPARGQKGRWLIWLFPFTGFVALIWFLIRVIPKPSRATYPCQRVAFPLASSFIIWLLGLAGSLSALCKAKRYRTQARFVLCAVFIAVSVGCVWLALSATEEKVTLAALQVSNDPIGVAQGVQPGRVVWIHDPNATDWDGYSSSEHWYDDNHTDQAVVDDMVSRAVRALAGESLEAVAWDSIFRNFNRRRGKGDVGYTAGEKIAIKINNTMCHNANTSTFEQQYDNKNRIDNSPQITVSLLDQLVNLVGVNEANITIGDPGRIMPNFYYNIVHPRFPNVCYMASHGGHGRTQSTFSNVEFHWSTRAAYGKRQDYIPRSFAEADYMINFAILKSHDGGGITVCGKNHYGSLLRNPNGTLRGQTYDYYDMHSSLPLFRRGMGHYRALVDLMGHPELSGKTVLYLVDGLFAGQNWDSRPFKWNMAPFNGDWPSSVFVSQDPVAIDSVCYDFLTTEWNDYSYYDGADDYLHEAALADNPPSGTFYNPNQDHVGLASQGVHEHWNNSLLKQYSRNLGIGEGIELISPVSGDFNGDGTVDSELKASTPSPPDGATIGPETPVLSWNPGHNAIEHDVFFGTNFDDVNNVDLFDNTGIYRGRWIDAGYAIEELDLDQTYYWRIDEVEADGTTVHKGDVWSFTVSLMGPVEDFETGNFSKFSWRHSGDSNWTISQREKHSGAYSARAGEINDEENSTLKVDLECVSGNITFYRKVSSERDCDFLEFYIDGIRQDKWSGEKDWVQVSFPVEEGTRTFEWIYSKDDSISRDSDTAWIDDISFPIE